MKLKHFKTTRSPGIIWPARLVTAGVLLTLFATAVAATPARAPVQVLPAGKQPARLADDAASPSSASLTFSQTSYVMAINTELTVDLLMNNAASVIGYETRLDFDPATLQVIAVTPGPLLSSTGRTANSLGPQPQAAGQVYIGGYTYGTQPAVTGSGIIGRITLRSVAVGQTTLSLSDPMVVTLDASGHVQTEPASVQGAQVTVTLPLAVTLASFEAAAEGAGVAVTWSTVSETDSMGFNVLRSDAPGGPRQQMAYVPSQAPGAAQGASYRWLDGDVTPGNTYYYWLEALSLDGGATLHGPVSVVLQAPTGVTLGGLSAGSE